jgi:hypothetical protein
MIRTMPLRLMILHLSQIFLIDDFTFMWFLSYFSFLFDTESNPASG